MRVGSIHSEVHAQLAQCDLENIIKMRKEWQRGFTVTLKYSNVLLFAVKSNVTSF